MENHHKGACPLCGGFWIEGVEEGLGCVGGAVARVDDVVGPGAVARHALLGQFVDAVAGGDGAALVGELIELAVEHHDLAVLV